MGMRKKLVKGFAYGMAPKAAFAAFNPKKAAFAKMAGVVMDQVTPNRRKSHRHSNLMGLGAAAVALPIGMWLGRRFFGREEYRVPTGS